MAELGLEPRSDSKQHNQLLLGTTVYNRKKIPDKNVLNKIEVYFPLIYKSLEVGGVELVW